MDKGKIIFENGTDAMTKQTEIDEGLLKTFDSAPFLLGVIDDKDAEIKHLKEEINILQLQYDAKLTTAQAPAIKELVECLESIKTGDYVTACRIKETLEKHR